MIWAGRCSPKRAPNGCPALRSFPHWATWALPTLAGTDELTQMVQLALVVAMVCIMQTAAVAGTFPSDEGRPDNVSRDFAGVGAGCILAGLIGAFAVDSSPPSTAVVHESGGRSQIASLTAVALMVTLAVAAAGLMAYVPHAALSGILLYIALRMHRIDESDPHWSPLKEAPWSPAGDAKPL
jgi:sulfate permease, SulP family